MTKKTDFMKFYCFGCGVQLQNESPNLPGYTPKSLKTDAEILCQRCYRLQHYGETYDDVVYTNDYKKIISQAKRERTLIVYVVDLFAFESSLIQSVLNELSKARVFVIASKRDVIPASINDKKLIEFIKNRFADYNVRPIDIVISSAKKNYNIDEIFARYTSLRKQRNVYIFGAASVGKSSLVNALLKIYKNNTMQEISTSPYPGTTLKVIKVPVDECSSIYDTPGILLEDSIFANIDRKLIKYVMPRKEIKPRVYQLSKQQSLIVENIAKIDFVDGDKSNFTVFMSNDLNIFRSKLENSDKSFNNMIVNKQIKLVDRNIKSIDDLTRHEFVLPNEDVDIVISGLLWVKVKGKGQRIVIHTLDKVSVHVRSCKI